MSRPARSLDAGYFEAIYAREPDPWGFATSAYEREKYAATCAALPRRNYANGLEVGCSIGVLTRELAPCCAALLAIDAAEAPLAEARARCAGLTQVAFRRLSVPQEWPTDAAPFDLMLFSEVLYYFDADDIARLVARAGDTLAAEADVLLVHWTGETNYPLSGEEAAERFIAAAAPFAAVTRQVRTEQYRLDLLRGMSSSDVPAG